MADIVISEFMDVPAVDNLRRDYDVRISTNTVRNVRNVLEGK